jgi:hypothetical protein
MRHIRDQIDVVSYERPNNHGEYDALSGEEKLVQRCFLILQLKISSRLTMVSHPRMHTYDLVIIRECKYKTLDCEDGNVYSE